MNTLRTTLTLIAAAVAVVAVTTQTPAQTHSSRNVGPGVYQHKDADASSFRPLTESNADPNSASCRQKRATMLDAAGATTFAAAAAQDGMTEVALAGLALQKSQNGRVRQFAQKVVHDRAQSNLALDVIVRCEGLILPTQLDAKYTALMNSLNAKSGSAFDRAYLLHTVNEHAAARALFELASSASDPEVATFAQRSLPTLQQDGHLADNLSASVGIQIAQAN